MLYHQGPNPTADCIITKMIDGRRYILLIRRSSKGTTEAGKLALPGGFVDGSSDKGQQWKPGKETYFQAAVRELLEETGLDLTMQPESSFRFVGVFDNISRDPRNTKDAWTESHVFATEISGDEDTEINGDDDAEHADWYSIPEIKAFGKEAFAFDHYDILNNFGFLETES
jgi:ADP-ribose pyrophosphatase YjhB (NUDIX family)